MIYSELSRYRESGLDSAGTVKMLHLESGDVVGISREYIENYMIPASHFTQTETVGQKDKLWTEGQVNAELDKLTFSLKATAAEIAEQARKVPKPGDVRVKGIRTIFREIPIGEVFTVVFRKAPTQKSQRAYQMEIEERVEKAKENLERIQRNKEGVLAAALDELKKAYLSPVLKQTPGPLRSLVGYKLSNGTDTSHYLCLDCEIRERRLVNITTIESLITRGVKYEVE